MCLYLFRSAITQKTAQADEQVESCATVMYAQDMTRRARLLSAVLLWLPASAPALGPHELLVLANESSADSVHIAKAYMRLRHIPAQNLVRLRIPLPAADVAADMTPDDFRQLIYAPAMQAARELGIAPHIQAWAYSTDFPTLITTPTNMSLTGMTFVRGSPPDMRQVGAGTYASPLFAGPNNPGLAGLAAQTFDVFGEWLGREMPLPAMLLGFTGPHGNTRSQILAALEKAALADHAFPTGTVYFVTSEDVRSKAREWQFRGTVRELQALHVAASIAPAFPEQVRDILGLMAGTATVHPPQYGNYLAGSVADHLTSAAGVFQSPNQTKLTAWIASGASASAGTVTEPFAFWTKFPHARLFAHYASGCTIIESLYQAIRCPLQILLVGDPLAQPFAPRGDVALLGLEKPSAAGSRRVTAEVTGDTARFGRIRFFVDGRPAGAGPELSLMDGAYGPGRHALRAVAYSAGTVRCQVFAEKEFEVP